jgi:multidrug resistance efflux pump
MAVQVKRERPDQRRHHRVTAPLFVRLAGSDQRLKARDWSLGGVRIDNAPIDIPALGSDIQAEITLPFQGFDITFEVEGRVIRRVPQSKSFAFEFTRLGERESSLMEHFINDLVRGVMSPTEDTIQRIDVPITPVSTEPDPNPKNVVKEKTIPLRQIAWAAVYATLGFVVFGYTALVLYSNLFRMEIQTAVVSAPVVEVRAQGDGNLPFIRVNQGQRVEEGETAIYFADYDLEKQIDLARLKIQEREAELNHLMQKRAAELEKMTEYASVEISSIEKGKVDVEGLEAEKQAALERVKRLEKLRKEGLTTKSQLDEANKWLISARTRLEARKVELKEQMRLADAGIGRHYFNGREIVGDLPDIEAGIKLARYQISLSHQAHEALLKHRERLAVRAPFTGIVSSLPFPENAAVRRGDVIAVFEKDSDRRITAYLTQDEVLKVALGDKASIYFPALNASLRGRVVSVDRTSGFKSEISRRYSWRGAEDRSAEVTLEFIDDPSEDTASQVTAGMPVIVLFEAQSTNPIIAAIWRRLSSLFL